MATLERRDSSLLTRWWWTIDRGSLLMFVLLLLFGAIISLTASPTIAHRLNLDTLYLVNRHFVFLLIGVCALVVLSFFSPVLNRRLAFIGLLVSMILVIATLIFGQEVNGAKRWLSVAGFSLQPSEFLKPFFAIAVAWLLHLHHQKILPPKVSGKLLATLLCIICVWLMLLQPDVGQAFLICLIWGAELFIAGLSWAWITAIAGGFAALSTTLYFSVSHFKERIDLFLFPEQGDTYQISKSLESFTNGGFFGVGPGEGRVKQSLPDSHADFVFAVIGEEFGLIACLLVVGIFFFVLMRNLQKAQASTSLFPLLAATGLLTQFGGQALVNMASTLNLIPTKGMTLPFISYGGSSLIALAMGMGFLLSFTRKQYHSRLEYPWLHGKSL